MKILCSHQIFVKSASVNTKSFSFTRNTKLLIPYEFDRKQIPRKFSIPLDIFNTELIKGVKFIYKNYIDSIREKDLKYLKEICEPGFYKQLAFSLIEDKEALFKNEIEENQIKIDIRSIFAELHMGAKLNRGYNKDLVEIKERPKFLSLVLGMFKEFFEVFGYRKENADKNEFSCVVRITAEVSSNLILSKEKVNNVLTKETHKLVFEAESDDKDSVLYIVNQSHKILKYFRKTEPDLKFVLADFDDYMGGNKLL